MRELLQSGVAEQVSEVSGGMRVYYMRHKPVYREDKTTTKTQIVFDASSSEPGLMSLNDHLSAGYNLIADLTKTLLRFRSNAIAVIADIEKAFLQISIAEQDRDSHRFLWYETVPKENELLPKIVEYRMARVTFGTTSSPFLQSATIQKHLIVSAQQYGPICDKLKKLFYVDDLIMSVSSHEEAKTTFIQANEIMAAAKLNLSKWNSNDVRL
ncbi:uncharacterized protein LOC118750001 [Rhagoletis pomonella]|uniref:uncharacterized protein LOC118750001 n=1 Tax=Rhagoletis pomonella TaxID=28610 RepID=UPI001781F8B3|nr:uncharacterized protein LOC118750001 [Rhagoletis pomonella]